MLANRGVAGIDGTIATATGAALTHAGPGYALVGDLIFLHAANGLLAGPDEARPDPTVVVANDDGGGIFELLEQGDPALAAALSPIPGVRVLEMRTERAGLRALHERIRAVVRAAVGSPVGGRA